MLVVGCDVLQIIENSIVDLLLTICWAVGLTAIVLVSARANFLQGSASPDPFEQFIRRWRETAGLSDEMLTREVLDER